MKVLIVDDEPLARSRLKRLLAQFPQYRCVAEAQTVAEALACYEKDEPDVLLLDIEMAGGNGLQLAQQLMQRPLPPAIIFVTAHPQHALDAYQVSPTDYLLKPVSAERLGQALARLGLATKAHLERGQATEPLISYQLGTTIRQIALSAVRYFAADSKYVRMVFLQGEALLEDSLVQLEQKYPQYLLRIHRGILINKQHFSALKTLSDGRHVIELDGINTPLEISRRAYPKLKATLQLD
ncbi:LytTR family DNA-binding domain-containing protein [Rheinheimera sp. FR7-31]|uniref:LytR/AlgR family response regulator transcription factor n=1 Tax=Rheinheimera fenheensis TaxID=3152295 RepID=UPI00325C40A8